MNAAANRSYEDDLVFLLARTESVYARWRTLEPITPTASARHRGDDGFMVGGDGTDLRGDVEAIPMESFVDL